MTFPLDDFIKEAKAQGHSDEFIQNTKNYAEKLVSKNLPVIFSIAHLSILARANVKLTYRICSHDRLRYYERFKLKKRRGGFRVIQNPTGQLKHLQKWILNNILENVPSHLSCKGFDKGTSIKQNAQQHLNAQCILKIDLLRFYDSINEKRLYGIFESLGYHKNLAVSLSKLCTVCPNDVFMQSFKKNEEELKQKILQSEEGVLPQGAPTSPKLSNLISRRLDERLTKLCEKNNLKYSRYADDLTFSGEEEVLRKIKSTIYRIIRDENFYVNYGKTQFLKRGSRYFVTGLSVHNDKVKVPRKMKKNIEHHLFHCKNSGVTEHKITGNIQNRNFKDWLFGCICFVNDVEPEIALVYYKQYNEINWPL